MITNVGNMRIYGKNFPVLLLNLIFLLFVDNSFITISPFLNCVRLAQTKSSLTFVAEKVWCNAIL